MSSYTEHMSSYLYSLASLECYSMPFLERECKKEFYKFLEPLGSHSFMKLSGLVTGLTTASLGIIFRIAAIAEIIIKCLVHILGAPFINDCSVLRGIGFLILIPAWSLKICFLPLSVIYCLADDILGMARDPVKHIQKNINYFDNNETLNIVCPELLNLPEGTFRTTYEEIKNAHESRKYKELLNLPENYTQLDVNHSFRKLCLKIHPDKNPKIEKEANLLMDFVEKIKIELLKEASS